MINMSQNKKRDSFWWGSLILVIYGVALTTIMMVMMVMYISNPILPEEEPQIGNTFAGLQEINPGLANYIWWVQNAFSLPGFTYPAIFTIALAWKGLRNRQKWAWYTILIPNIAFWILFYVGCRAMHTTYLEHWLVFTPFFVLFLIGVILPARQILASKDQKGV
jgi:hypothetical protein